MCFIPHKLRAVASLTMSRHRKWSNLRPLIGLGYVKQIVFRIYVAVIPRYMTSYASCDCSDIIENLTASYVSKHYPGASRGALTHYSASSRHPAASYLPVSGPVPLSSPALQPIVSASGVTGERSTGSGGQQPVRATSAAVYGDADTIYRSVDTRQSRRRRSHFPAVTQRLNGKQKQCSARSRKTKLATIPRM